MAATGAAGADAGHGGTADGFGGAADPHDLGRVGNSSGDRRGRAAVAVHSHPPAADPGDSGCVRGVRDPDVGSASDSPHGRPAAAEGVLVPEPAGVPFRRPLLAAGMDDWVPPDLIPDGSVPGLVIGAPE